MEPFLGQKCSKIEKFQRKKEKEIVSKSEKKKVAVAIDRGERNWRKFISI